MKTMTGNTDQAPAYNSRWEERDARRQASKDAAMEAAANRAARRSGTTLVTRVENAKAKLGCNTVQAIQLIQSVSSADYDIYLLAEKYGRERRGVLKQFGAPRGSVETAYLAEAGLASPQDAPDVGAEE